ncbi:putative metal-binding protein [Hymenobacter profundi]|uniref:DUF2604 domain-containing protein n=1 Tax=Hymenobacter profundi TaxID=1982110 RepID=A0ABS6WUE8_9BACT|nr:putative metal-binding protein [Hymenobacter profundi]MBW3127205.1 DUF2604 domain-containing protein [Hymenobacter profundi]
MKDSLPNGHNGHPAPDPTPNNLQSAVPVGASPTSNGTSANNQETVDNASSKSKDKEPKNHEPSGSGPKDPKEEKPDDKGPKQEQRLTLLVIVNTAETRVEANVHQPLHVIAQHALNESGNAEYPLSEWTLTDDKGTVLDLSRKVEDYAFAPLTKLFLSKEVGAGGSTDVQVLPEPQLVKHIGTAQVDPQVTRAKFNDEVAKFRSSDVAQRARGILLLKAEFPYVLLGFAAPRLRPTPLLFGVRIDFSEYDLQPPSVQFVDPFTERALRVEEMPTQFLKRNGDLPKPDANGAIQLSVQPLLQHHAPDGPPFLCVRGTREYHEHPAHTGDSWHLYRGTTVGTLGHIIDVLYTYGINPLTGYQFNVNMALPPDPQRIAS